MTCFFNRRAGGVCLWATAVALSSSFEGYAASPVLTNLRPQGLQRGAESEIVFSGARLSDAKQVLFYHPGVTATALKVINDSQVQVKFKAAVDCRLGEHAVRLVTASGLSELRTFFVGPYPSVEEKEPNSEFESAQSVPFNVTVVGVIQSEDVDYFKVQAKKGQRISVELEGMRLANTIFDANVSIMNKGRFVLASSDDNILLNQDPACSIIAPADGAYYVEVREASYRGDGNCMYRLHIGEFPRPQAVYPAGGKGGETVSLTFIGDPRGSFHQSIALPKTYVGNYPAFAVQGGATAPSPNWLRVSDFPNVMEVEPNNDFAKATKTSLPLPLAFNGIIGEAGDVDCFRFKATQGQTFDVTVHARSLRSPLDSVLHLYYGDGRYITSNDDNGAWPDSYIRFQVPATGEYIARISDHLLKGGPDYIYRCEFTPVKPLLELSIPEFVQYQQDRRAVAVARGNRMATLISAKRADFGGELKIAMAGLPKGVTFSSENMHQGLTTVPVLFEAAADAPLGVSLVDVQGSHVDPKQGISGGFHQDLTLIFGEPGNTTYWKYTADKLAVAVVEELPFSVKIIEPRAPLVQDGSLNLKIVVTRKPGFKAAVTVSNLFNPPGVSSVPAISIAENQTEGTYAFNANRGAEPRSWKLLFQASADGGKGPMWASTQQGTLRIAAPYCEMALQMAAAEQGKPVEVVCKVDQKTPFAGEATATLVGLPAQVAAPPMKLTKDLKELVFKLTVGKDAPAGQHKTLFCQVVVTEKGEPVAHALGYGGVLRIDPPPPPKKNEPPKPVVKVEPKAAPAKVVVAPPAPKRLSRLEQLRLEQADKAKALGAK